MKLIKKQNDIYVLRIDKGEELIATLKKFSKEQKIRAAFFTAIGAAQTTELAYFDPRKKRYIPRIYREPMEIVSIMGNVALLKDEPVIHAHGVLGNLRMELCGGHINTMVISTIAEVYLERLRGRIRKAHSKEIGLNIMDR